MHPFLNLTYLPMNYQQYLEHRNDLIARHSGNMQGLTTQSDARLAITSANLMHFWPQADVREHQRLFSEILFHQSMSGLEQKYPGILSFVETRFEHAETESMLINGPSVICTFHSGSYRVINHYLLSRKVSYCLVVAGKISREQGEIFKHDCNNFYPDLEDSFSVIDAEAPYGALAMVRSLRDGKSLLVYVDGNTGAIAGDRRKSTLISSGNASFYARTGFANIAALAGVPLIPVISLRESLERIVLTFHRPVFFNSSVIWERFAGGVTRKLYTDFFSALHGYAGQWEGWLYLHHFLTGMRLGVDDVSMSKTTLKMIIDEVKNAPGSFACFTINDEYFLFDKRSYTSLCVDVNNYCRFRDVIAKYFDNQ